MTHAECPTSHSQSDLSNDQLRMEIDRTLKKLFNPNAKWHPGKKKEFELYFIELVEEVTRRLP